MSIEEPSRANHSRTHTHTHASTRLKIYLSSNFKWNNPLPRRLPHLLNHCTVQFNWCQLNKSFQCKPYAYAHFAFFAQRLWNFVDFLLIRLKIFNAFALTSRFHWKYVSIISLALSKRHFYPRTSATSLCEHAYILHIRFNKMFPQQIFTHQSLSMYRSSFDCHVKNIANDESSVHVC